VDRAALSLNQLFIPAVYRKQMEQSSSKMAFTLLELSIVLVIIGLIVGGILIGEELIHAGKLRAQVSQIGEINRAVNVFRLKYNCLPGDCANATTFFTSVVNGDGNGRITGYCSSGSLAYEPILNGQYCPAYSAGISVQNEWFHAFDHLSAAGLTTLPRYNENDNTNNYAGGAFPAQMLPAGHYKPSTAIYVDAKGAIEPQGGIVFGYEPGGHRIRLGECTYQSWNINTPVFGCTPTPADVLALDTKLDDGSLTTGRAFVTDNAYLYNYQFGQDYRNLCTDHLADSLKDIVGECPWSIKAEF
jgi:type II secretory pathway pseudopilin PulG